MTENIPNPTPRKINNTFYRRTGLIFTGVGLALFILGAQPDWFGLNISEAIGAVQIGVFSFGLILIAVGGSLAINSLWPPHWRSISADFGLRLVWSGVVLAIISAMADIMGLGTRPLSSSFIFFGYWQARGIMAGQAIMFIGFIMMIPKKKDVPPPVEEPQKAAPEQSMDNHAADELDEPEEEQPPAAESDAKIDLTIE